MMNAQHNLLELLLYLCEFVGMKYSINGQFPTHALNKTFLMLNPELHSPRLNL